MQPTREHLLRTLAAVPPASRILEVQCGRGALTLALARLGYDVDACDTRPEAVEATRRALSEELAKTVDAARVQPAPAGALPHPEASFDWVISCEADRGRASADALRTHLAHVRRVLRPGGWVYLTARAPSAHGPRAAFDAGLSADALRRLAAEAGLVEAEAPAAVEEAAGRRWRAIFRRVENGTPA